MWIVTKYRKRGDDSLVEEYPLKGARASELRRIFDADGDDNIALSYRSGSRSGRMSRSSLD